MLFEIAGGHALNWRAEFGQSREIASAFCGSGFTNIEVFGCTRLRANRDRVGSNHKVLNPVRVEDGQEFFEVWVHLDPSADSVLELVRKLR